MLRGVKVYHWRLKGGVRVNAAILYFCFGGDFWRDVMNGPLFIPFSALFSFI